jgi:hypothetical protein
MTPTFPYIDFERARAEEEETVPFCLPNGYRGRLVEHGGSILWAMASRPGRKTLGWASDDSKYARTPK